MKRERRREKQREGRVEEKGEQYIKGECEVGRCVARKGRRI
jgi:hypothetical protein